MFSVAQRTARLLRTTLCWLLTLIFVATPGIAWAGASVSVQRGFFAYDTVDLQTSGAYPLTIVRHYQSAKSDGSAVTSGPFGPGTHMGIYSLRATFDPAANKVRVYMPTGEQTYFNFNSALGKYTNASRADGLRGTVTVSVSGTTTFITLALENGTKLFFDNSSGVNKLTSIKDRFAQSQRFVYANFSGGQRLIQVFEPSNRHFQLYYSDARFNQVTSIEVVDSAGAQVGSRVEYYYDSNSDLQRTANPMQGASVQDVNASGQIITRTANGVTSYSYDGSHRVVSVTNPRGITALANTYSSGKVTSQRMPGSTTSTTSDDILNYYAYSSGSTVVRDTLNATNRQTTYTYNSSNNYLSQVSNAADSSATAYSFNSTSGLLASRTDAYGFITSYSYNFDGLYDHLTQVSEHNSAYTEYHFGAPFGQLDYLIDANGHIALDLNYAADGTGVNTEILTPIPYVFLTAHNAYGQVLEEIDGVGRTTRYAYNAYRDLETVTEQSGLSTYTHYDVLSRPNWTYPTTDPNYKTTIYYDKLDRVTKVIEPGSRTTTFTYDDNSNVTSVTAPNGVRTVYTYTAQDQVATRKQASYTESYSYNNLGQLSSTRDAKGQTTSYTYDLKGRVQKVTYADASFLTYTYDKLDRVTGITDSTSATKNVSFTYENDNTQITGPVRVITGSGTSGQDTLWYTYDRVGNLLKVTRSTTSGDDDDPPPCEGDYCDPPCKQGCVPTIAGSTTEATTTYTDLLQYNYNFDDSLQSATLLGGSSLTVNFAYNRAGQLTGIGYPGTSGSVLYNTAGEVSSLYFANLRQVNYFYDYGSSASTGDKGYLTRREEFGPSRPGVAATQNYAYHPTGELWCTYPASGCSGGQYTYANSYDADGNPTDTNNDGQFLGTTTYQTGTNRMASFRGRPVTTDANGNITNDGINFYTWNARNQLVAMSSGAGTVSASFTYDALGRRISRTVNGVTTTYTLSGNQVIEERTNGVVKRYLVGLGLDEVWAVRTGSTDEYLLHDVYTNNVIAAVDRASVTVKTGYGYSPFGVVTKSNSPTPSANTMQYGGHENDGTGLSYYRARYYSPVLQRFIGEDPIGFSGGDTNLYRYVGNNPHVGSDATGLCGIECNSSAFSESVDSVFFEGGAVSERSPYRGYRPEGLPLPSGGRDGTLVAFAPALVVAPLVVDVAIAVGAAALFRAGLTYITGPGPQPALDGAVFKAGEYAPDRPLPRDPRSGYPVPDSQHPHTQLGKRTSKTRGETYTQGREFGENGKHIKDVDFTNHGRGDHTNPHQHPIHPKTGKRGRQVPLIP